MEKMNSGLALAFAILAFMAGLICGNKIPRYEKESEVTNYPELIYQIKTGDDFEPKRLMLYRYEVDGKEYYQLMGD